MANMAGKINVQNSWLIDSGASDHVTHHKEWLKSIKVYKEESSVVIANGDSIQVKGVGNINLTVDLELKHVLNVPNFKCNLLSVSKLTRDLNCFLTFYPDKCFIQDLRMKSLIGMGKDQDGVYRLDPFKKRKVAMSVMVQ